MSRRFRVLPVGLLAAAAVPLCSAATAQASLLTQSAANCNNESVSQTFQPWQDSSEYFQVPGGAFSANAQGWTLNGAAGVVGGGDGFSLNGNAPSANSLALPAGSAATTPAICVGVNDPDVRFFAENSGSSNSMLQVSVTFQTILGLTATLPIAYISAGSTWAPTAPLPIAVNLLTLLPNNQTPVTVTFTPEGQGGNWQIDDAWVDPAGHGG